MTKPLTVSFIPTERQQVVLDTEHLKRSIGLNTLAPSSPRQAKRKKTYLTSPAMVVSSDVDFGRTSGLGKR